MLLTQIPVASTQVLTCACAGAETAATSAIVANDPDETNLQPARARDVVYRRGRMERTVDAVRTPNSASHRCCQQLEAEPAQPAARWITIVGRTATIVATEGCGFVFLLLLRSGHAICCNRPAYAGHAVADFDNHQRARCEATCERAAVACLSGSISACYREWLCQKREITGVPCSRANGKVLFSGHVDDWHGNQRATAGTDESDIPKILSERNATAAALHVGRRACTMRDQFDRFVGKYSARRGPPGGPLPKRGIADAD